MKNTKSLLLNLRSVDVAVISFGIFLTILNLIFYSDVQHALLLIIANTTVSFLLIWLAYADCKFDSRIIKHIHIWYMIPLIFFSFKELYLMVKPISGDDIDYILISIDRFILGTDATLELFKISNPFLTELLQIVYGTFFFLPIILAVDLYKNNRLESVYYVSFMIVFGFFLSYIGYFIAPAIGPRFTLHNFELTNVELPGIFLTNFLREVVNAGESIPTGTLNPALFVQRDVFPSGHTQMTLIVMYLSFKLKTTSRHFFYPIGTLLIFSTVYLRYHYLIDVFAGFVFMIITIWVGKILYNKWNLLKGNNAFKYSEN